MYGPTEVTAVTVQHVFPESPTQVVIGRPDANVHAYVVDSHHRPVPIGVPGELVLSGPRLAIGEDYLCSLTMRLTPNCMLCPLRHCMVVTIPCPLPAPQAMLAALI